MKRILLLTASALLVSSNVAQAEVPLTLPQAQSAVDSWYRQFLGRLPDPSAAGWVLALVKGRPAGYVLADILSSREYFARAGRTNAGFVGQLYKDQLGLRPDRCRTHLLDEPFGTQFAKEHRVLVSCQPGEHKCCRPESETSTAPAPRLMVGLCFPGERWGQPPIPSNRGAYAHRSPKSSPASEHIPVGEEAKSFSSMVWYLHTFQGASMRLRLRRGLPR